MAGKIKKFESFLKKVFKGESELLKKELSGFASVLDLGCGFNSLLQYCNKLFSVGVESFEPYLEKSKEKKIHNEYIKADIRKIDFGKKSFDAIIALEVIEHLTKEEGYELIRKMEKWARKKIIISTPNGYIWQNGYDNNPLQEHKSGWSVEELEKLGFRVKGISGWKKLRGYKGSIRYEPNFFWKIISDLTRLIVYYCPKLAFQLFCVKEIDEKNKYR